MHLKNQNTWGLEFLFKITKIQYKFYNILYSFMWQDINLQDTDHRIDGVQYIEVQACDNYIVFCILSCTDNGGVPYKQEQLLAAMSTEHPIHLFYSLSSPSYMGMEAQGRNQHLSPNTTSLVRSSLGMLSQHCLCWGKFIDCSNFLVNNYWLALFTWMFITCSVL